MSPDLMRSRLRDLRKRRGRFGSPANAEAEIARLLSRLVPGSLERKAFQLSEVSCLPFKGVADALGVSERHLYRIRVRLFEQLALEEEAVSVHTVISGEEQCIELARVLVCYGHPARAFEITDRLLDTEMPAAQAVEALATRANALSGQERYDDARASLEEARSLLHRLDDRAADNARRRITMAEAYVPYRDGLSDVAIDLSERAVQTYVPKDQLEAREYARNLIFLAIQHEEAHNPRRGLECLAKAYAVLTRLPVPPSAELAQILVHRALLRLCRSR